MQLNELRERRNTFAAAIRSAGDKFTANGNKWPDDAARKTYEANCREYDLAMATIRAAESARFTADGQLELDNIEDHLEERNPNIGPNEFRSVLDSDDNSSSNRNQFIPGREDTPLIRRRTLERDKPQTADKAISAWMRSIYGVPVPPDEFRAAQQYGINPNSSAFEVRLNSCRPTPGRDLSFSRREQRTELSSVIASTGGVTVPSGFIPRLEAAMKAFGPMLQVAEVMVTDDARELPWPTLDDAAEEGYQLGENTAVAEDDMTFGAHVFRAYKLSSKLIRAPHELIRDSALNLANELGTALGIRLGRILNKKCTTGLGASTFYGIVNDAASGVVAASQTQITMDELISLQDSVDPAYRFDPGAGWMMHSNVATHIRKLKDGDGNYLWQSSLILGQPPMLLGAPVYINNDMASSIATGAKTVLYGKLNQYKIRLVGRVRFRQLVERYAEYDQVGFLSFQEGDGKLLKPSTDTTLCPVKYLAQA